MPDSPQDNSPNGPPGGSNQPSSSSPPQIPDLEEYRQKWDAKLEADFAEINEILRRQSGRDREAHAAQQNANARTQ